LIYKLISNFVNQIEIPVNAAFPARWPDAVTPWKRSVNIPGPRNGQGRGGKKNFGGGAGRKAASSLS
jgi:hypothetical protein